MAEGESGLGLTLLSCILAGSALKMPLLRKGPITDGHRHIPFVAKWIYHLHALPHGDLVEAVVFLEEKDRWDLFIKTSVLLPVKPMLKGRGRSFLTDEPFSSLPDTPHPQLQHLKARAQHTP